VRAAFETATDAELQAQTVADEAMALRANASTLKSEASSEASRIVAAADEQAGATLAWAARKAWNISNDANRTAEAINAAANEQVSAANTALDHANSALSRIKLAIVQLTSEQAAKQDEHHQISLQISSSRFRWFLRLWFSRSKRALEETLVRLKAYIKIRHQEKLGAEKAVVAAREEVDKAEANRTSKKKQAKKLLAQSKSAARKVPVAAKRTADEITVAAGRNATMLTRQAVRAAKGLLKQAGQQEKAVEKLHKKAQTCRLRQEC